MSARPNPPGWCRPNEMWRVEEDGSLVAVDRARPCWGRKCDRIGIAMTPKGHAWCEEHIKPCWVEDGRVLVWVLRPLRAGWDRAVAIGGIIPRARA